MDRKMTPAECRAALLGQMEYFQRRGFSRDIALGLVALDNGLSPAYVAWLLSGHWPVRRSREVTISGAS